MKFSFHYHFENWNHKLNFFCCCCLNERCHKKRMNLYTIFRLRVHFYYNLTEPNKFDIIKKRKQNKTKFSTLLRNNNECLWREQHHRKKSKKKSIHRIFRTQVLFVVVFPFADCAFSIVCENYCRKLISLQNVRMTDE